MMVAAAERDRAIQRLRLNVERFAEQVRSLPDPSMKIPHLAWNVTDTAAHIDAMGDLYIRLAQGDPSPVVDLGVMAEANALLIESVTDREPPHLADRIERNFKRLISMFEAWPGDRPFRWHAGIDLTLSELLGVLLGELNVHGWDIARAMGRSWSIEREDAIHIFVGATRLMPYYVDQEASAGVRAVYELRLRGDDVYYLHFDYGNLEVHPATADARPDCRLSVDPAAFVLVSYGRISPVIPSLTGRMIAWGRRPWLAFKLTRLLQHP